MENNYDILPNRTNINSYNRYPFANYQEAVDNLTVKSLQPGEFAVAYYWDETSVIGISAVFAIGNLKKHGNQIFKNALQIEALYGDMLAKVGHQNIAINDCINTLNMTNKNYAAIHKLVHEIDAYAHSLEHKISGCTFVDLDKYTEDL